MSPHSWEEDSVENISEGAGLSCLRGEGDFFDELTLDSCDIELALCVISFADHDTLICWEIVVFLIMDWLL